MAKSTTYNGAPKPFGGKGHYWESRRHALQAQGIQTGHKAEALSPVVEEQPLDLGIYNATPKKEEQEEEVTIEPVTYSLGGEEVVVEPAKPKKTSVIQKLKDIEKKIEAGYQREKAIKAREKREQLAKDLDKEPDEEDEDQEELEEELDQQGFEGGSRFGKILADIFNTYSSEDLMPLTNDEIETLAVKYESTTKDAFFKMENPFLVELKNRLKAEEQVKLEKVKLQAELEPTREQVRREIAEIRAKARDTKPEKGLLSEIWNWE